MKNFTLTILLFFLIYMNSATGQKISGIIKDENNQPVIGATVVIKGTAVGAATDFDGKFEFETTMQPPFVLEVSFVGYGKQDINVKDFSRPVDVKLRPQEFKIKDVEIQGSRISEKQKQSALTVESIDRIAIKQCAQTTFYESLGTLKGVDLTTASLGFTIINTRGFNSTSPVRSLQVIDGADNQAPGLNFSLGNFLGASELDVMKVDLISGASTAYYGPNAFNGVISMTTRSPFVNPTLEVQLKAGERNLYEGAFRWAQVFKNKKGEDKFAYKLNAYFLTANDWEANNMDSTHQSKHDAKNPGGYDAVNIYGDEYSLMGNYSKEPIAKPGLYVSYRTGYRESDLVDNETKNIKLNAAFHYRINSSTELIYSSSYGAGTTIYQGDNRYSLKDIKYYQNKIELVQKDKFFIRAYVTNEDAGKSYDAFFTALLLQNAVKSDEHWYSDYASNWVGQYTNYIRTFPGYPAGPTPPFTPQQFIDYANSIYPFLYNNYYDSLVKFHNATRQYADGIGLPGNLEDPFLQPGTARFDSALNAITSKYSFNEGGSRFYDKSSLYNIQGEYKFDMRLLRLVTGGNFRLYKPKSNGTIFSDTGNVVITNKEYGFYTGLEKSILKERLDLNVTARIDKNENFDYNISPAISAVYKLKGKHFFRACYSAAIRNPTLMDQYIYYNVGRATLVGNVHGFDSLVTIESMYKSFSYSNDSLKYFNIDPIRTEKVKTIELGYRGILFNKLYVDAGYYYSYYRDFIGYKIGAKVRPNFIGLMVDSIYRVSTNATDVVTTQGFSIGINYYLTKILEITGNYSWNQLNRHGSTDPLIPAFNTPEHKYNIGLNGRDIHTTIHLFKKEIPFNNYGFSINYKWIEGFLYEGSPQFTGYIKTYGLVDVQINKCIPSVSCTFKIGASNLLNNKVYEVYGGPQVGRLAYISIMFELKNNNHK